MSHAPKHLPPLHDAKDEPTSSRERTFLAFGRVDIICVITLSLIVLHLTGVLPQMRSLWTGLSEHSATAAVTTEIAK